MKFKALFWTPCPQDLPPEVFGFNAGFSCKSFSKLHGEWKKFKSAMLDNNEDATLLLLIFYCPFLVVVVVVEQLSEDMVRSPGRTAPASLLSSVS